MATLTTPALVIRRSDYGDYDRMVTLFSPEMGRVDAIARGCRRPKSPLVNAVEPFTSGEFQLYAHKDRYSMEQCQISDSYFELRSDYDRLRHADHMLGGPGHFLSLLDELGGGSLANGTEFGTFAFEAHFMRLNGLSPRMDACVRCGRSIDGDARFDPELGGAVCMSCHWDAPFVSNGARRILMKLPRTQFDRFQLLADRPEWPEAARLCRSHVNLRMHMERFAPELYSTESSEQ